jgi:ribonuclease P protein component
MKWLKKNYEYSDVFSFKKRFVTNNFFYFYKPNQELCAGVIVTKKEGNACERHKIKRQVKSILLEENKLSNFKFKIIIKAKNKFSINNFNEVNHEIIGALKKISRKVEGWY